MPTTTDTLTTAFAAIVELRERHPDLRTVLVVRDDDELVRWRRAVDQSLHGPLWHEIDIRRTSQPLYLSRRKLLHICARSTFFAPDFAEILAFPHERPKRTLLLVSEESVVSGNEAKWAQATESATYWLLLGSSQFRSSMSASRPPRPTLRRTTTQSAAGWLSVQSRQDVGGIRLRQPLRPWQHEALHEWEARGKRGIVQAVTGAGKTMLALGAIERCLAQDPDTVVQIVVPTGVLLEQWYSVLQQHLGLWDREIGLCGGGCADDPMNRRVLIYVVNSARNQLPLHAVDLRLSRPKLPILLISDECHRLGSPENARALRGGATWTLGISATPEREGDFGFERILQPRLGPVVFRYGYARALRDGTIHPFSISYVLVFALPHGRRVLPSFGWWVLDIVWALSTDSEHLPHNRLRRGNYI